MDYARKYVDEATAGIDALGKRLAQAQQNISDCRQLATLARKRVRRIRAQLRRMRAA